MDRKCRQKFENIAIIFGKLIMKAFMSIDLWLVSFLPVNHIWAIISSYLNSVLGEVNLLHQ